MSDTTAKPADRSRHRIVRDGWSPAMSMLSVLSRLVKQHLRRRVVRSQPLSFSDSAISGAPRSPCGYIAVTTARSLTASRPDRAQQAFIAIPPSHQDLPHGRITRHGRTTTSQRELTQYSVRFFRQEPD